MVMNADARIQDGFYIGLMSGTSVDGIDAALVEVHGGVAALRVQVLAHHQQPWPKVLRERLLAVMAPAAVPTAEICELNMLVARHFAGAALKVLKQAGLATSQITAIGSHGQTICHLPPARGRKRGSQLGGNFGGDMGSTLQIGDPSVIAALTGMTTVGNFRPADMAAGGQGAPLVPLVDKLLFTHRHKARCIQNIGGIGNVTWLPAHGTLDDVIAFDTGPGNMLIDAVTALITKGAKTYDRGGKLAAAGRINRLLLKKLQSLEYFSRRPPKSTGRELFGVLQGQKLLQEHPTVSGRDVLATVTELTAWSIAASYQKFLPGIPDETILCGGGAENPFLVERMKVHLGNAGCHCVQCITELGIINQAREAMAFAVLAALTLNNIPGNVPAATGARQAVILGTISRGGV
jgi:anhydro-N-acetylmuramic acid kinase